MLRIFDAHCDTMCRLLEKGQSLENASGMVSSPMMREYKSYIQVFAAWVDGKNPLMQAIMLRDKFMTETKNSSLKVIDSRGALEDISTNGGYGAILALENGSALCGSIEMVDVLYRLGFRLITLTWNGSNELGFGAVESNGDGLTPFGKEVVKRMNALGMIIDVSHLSEKGFWDVAECSEMPFVASHSNAKAICNHPRNLSDEQIKEIIYRRGVIGINLYDSFLSDDGNSDINKVIEHIEHIMSLGGENSIGIGTDFDGIPKSAKGLENVSCLRKLANELSILGYSEEQIDKIMYCNFERLFMECIY